MGLPIQVLHAYYKGHSLSVLDSDDRTSLYTVKTLPTAFQILPSAPTTVTPIASASFSIISTNVKLFLYNHAILLHREKTFAFTRTYTYLSPTPALTDDGVGKSVMQKMHWEAEDIMSGDFKLVDGKGEVYAWFRNKVFSTTELGRFEIMEGMEGRQVEVLVTGLAMLAMVQSGKFGLMIIAGN